jgi:hypothetical protein
MLFCLIKFHLLWNVSDITQVQRPITEEYTRIYMGPDEKWDQLSIAVSAPQDF